MNSSTRAREIMHNVLVVEEPQTRSLSADLPRFAKMICPLVGVVSATRGRCCGAVGKRWS